MKKLLFSSLFLIAAFGYTQAQSCQPSTCCTANGKANTGISKATLRKIIQKKYQHAQIKDIRYNRGYYCTTLLANNQTLKTYHTGQGQWQSTKFYVPKATLPAKVRQTLKSQNQWNYVNTAYKIEYPTRQGGYVAQTAQGRRIDFNEEGVCLTNLKCNPRASFDRNKNSNDRLSQVFMFNN